MARDGSGTSFGQWQRKCEVATHTGVYTGSVEFRFETG